MKHLRCHFKHVLLLLLCALPPLTANAATAVIAVRFQHAANLAEMLAPHLAKGESVSARGNRMVIDAEPARLEELRGLVAKLDNRPRRLLISVREQGQSALGGSRQSRPGPWGPRQFSAWHWQTRSRNDGSRSVQTLEGRPTRIFYGQSAPLHQASRQWINGRMVERHHVQLRNARRGFFALPRVQDDEVTVEIYAASERPSPNTGRFDIQRAQTVLRGRLGEWLTLGRVSGEQESQSPGYQSATRRAQDSLVELRVTSPD